MRVKFYHFFVLDLNTLVLKAGKHQKSVKLLHLNCQIESGVLQEPLLPGFLYGRHSGHLHYRKCTI